MGEAKINAMPPAHPVDPPRAVTLEESFELTKEAWQHERRRAAVLEQVVVNQLAAIGLAIDNIMARLAVLERKSEPKSSIIQMKDFQ